MRQCKRFEIADRLAGELQIIPESRMLTVVGQAMKYKRYIGELPMNNGQNVVKFNLFADKLFEKKKRRDGCGVPRRGKQNQIGKKRLILPAYCSIRITLLVEVLMDLSKYLIRARQNIHFWIIKLKKISYL